MTGAAGSLPVLVVGAGPAGLTTATELLRRGVPVRCVDRAQGPSTLSKALGLWPRTLELIRRVGGDELLSVRALPQSQMRYYSDGKVIANLRYRPATRPLICPQPDVEEVLRTNLASVGGAPEWRTELLGFDQLADRVRATLRGPDGTESTEDFSHLIGADGASSTVRDRLGVDFTGSTYELRFVVADVLVDTRLDHRMTHYFCSPRGILVACGLPDGRWRVFTSAPPGLTQDEADLAAVQRLVDERGPGGIALREPDWISVFSVHARHADTTRVGRVFLMGDAAHIHSPAGGQGLNTSVTDAHNLAWKLALVWHGRSGDRLLDSYVSERGDVAKSVVRQADVQTRIWLLRKGHQVALRDNALRVASGLRLFDLAYVPWLAGLRTRYAAEPGAGRGRAGFVPGALVPLPLRSALDDLRHTLLVSDPDAGALRSLVGWCEAELAEVVDVRVVSGLGRRVAVLARPDGHVDWTVKDDAAAMRARLTDLFRPLLRTRQQASGERPRRHGDDGARQAPSPHTEHTDEARQEVQA
ncbi:FAD-dependent monooxygenase [Streptomyces montanisoli]|uniref:FAD-dependent monooxygenase n=1 Tax=Streptomyces montanisoli TaxID=2798581 RepID=A0A940MD05_9ACTN|nr:FAD-dependent monooxygenase [Streptomyces montanisoli]MBP0458777.1 FAD-dependent monooxygenase [Streptomyces montanisoli]